MTFNRNQIFTQISMAEPVTEQPIDADVVIDAEPVEEPTVLPPLSVFTITSETRLEDIQQIKQFTVEIDNRAGEVSVEKVAAIPAHVRRLSFKGDEANRMTLSAELIKAIKPSVGSLYLRGVVEPMKDDWHVLSSETKVRTIYFHPGPNGRTSSVVLTSRATNTDVRVLPISVTKIG